MLLDSNQYKKAVDLKNAILQSKRDNPQGWSKNGQDFAQKQWFKDAIVAPSKIKNTPSTPKGLTETQVMQNKKAEQAYANAQIRINQMGLDKPQRLTDFNRNNDYSRVNLEKMSRSYTLPNNYSNYAKQFWDTGGAGKPSSKNKSGKAVWNPYTGKYEVY
jgi:hypothetical protein